MAHVSVLETACEEKLNGGRKLQKLHCTCHLHSSPQNRQTCRQSYTLEKKGLISIKCNNFKETQIIINFTRVCNIS